MLIRLRIELRSTEDPGVHAGDNTNTAFTVIRFQARRPAQSPEAQAHVLRSVVLAITLSCLLDLRRWLLYDEVKW